MPDSLTPNRAAALQRTMLQISALTRHQLSRTLSRYQLTVPQYMALAVVARTDDEAGVSMSDLADATHQVSATMTGIIDRLMERGLVHRHRDPNDRRSWRVLLTPEGEAIVQQVEAARDANFQAVVAEFSPEEQHTLRQLMDKYLAIITEKVASQP